MSDSDTSPTSTLEDYDKKTRIVAAWLLNHNLRGSEAAAEALNCTGQYIRDVTSVLNTEGPEAIDPNTLQTARSATVSSLIKERLEENGIPIGDDSRPTYTPTNLSGSAQEQLKELRDELQLLKTEAEWSEDGGQEFVANHALTRIESILDTIDTDD